MNNATRTPADQARRLAGQRYRMADHYEAARSPPSTPSSGPRPSP
ncbi:hypothetical protein [Nocardia sp. BMG51109]|nr:hypothetical protein [Nocardia sp. BMG51109]